MFAYQKSFTTSAFHVVRRDEDGNLGSTVAGSNDKQFANGDAADRNRRAKDIGLDCSYVVKARQDGHVA